MNTSLTIQRRIEFTHGQRGRKAVVAMKTAPATIPSGRVPRVARLMALAIRFDGLLAQGEFCDYADIARLGHVTRARVTQIMNLLNLATDIQEGLLFLPSITDGRDPIKEWQLRSIAAEPIWRKQRQAWAQLMVQAPAAR